jgi:hypothetical protein
VTRRYWLLPLTTLLLWPWALQHLAARAATAAESASAALGRLQRVAPAGEVALPPASDPNGASAFEQLPGDAAVFESGTQAKANSAASATKTKRSSKAPDPGKPSSSPSLPLVAPKFGIRVPAQTVLRLANARAVPQGTFVPAESGRPAGMRLQGVSNYGVGLRDGDVLTQVAGIPSTSRSQVVNAVLQARAVKAPAVSAIFWREGEPWRLLVEMPYLQGG